ncbi:Arylesterase [Candidatus Entotheonellaceae bacterium PAL068K]
MPHEIINGFRMYYEVIGAGMPLLFVHGGLGGGPGSATFRQHHMTELAQYAEVIAFDRRAAGVSETPTAGYSFDLFVTDIFALLDHLGHQQAILMATSAGGPLVLQAALRYPERVLGLVLGSTASQTVHVPPELAALVTFLGTDGLTQLQAMLGRQRSGEPTRAAEPAVLPADGFGGVLQTYLAYHLHGDPVAARLGEITVPALILHGTADEEVPFAEAERLHAGLPDAALIPFQGGGHGILVSHAVPYRQAIARFLQALTPSP